jgi:hypothetical protein
MALQLDLHSVEIWGQHVATKDMTGYMCKAPAIGGTNFNDFQVSEFSAEILSATMDVSGCKKIADGSEGIVGFIIAIVQGVLLVILGPAVAIYGPTFKHFTSLVQAVIASSYVLLIASIVAIDAFSAFTVVERCVTMIISTLTVTYTSVNSAGARAKVAGFSLGQLIMTPLMAFVSELIYKNALKCDKFGAKSVYFPNGMPEAQNGVDCNKWSTGFQLTYQLTQLAKWFVIMACAYKGKKVVNFATSVAGSSMFIKGAVDLVKAIGYQFFPDDAIQILTVVTPIRAWGTYGVAILAYLLQRKLLTSSKDAAGVVTFARTDPHPKLMNIFFGCLINCLDRINKFLLDNMATLKDLKGASMKKLTPSKPKEKEPDPTKLTA